MSTDVVFRQLEFLEKRITEFRSLPRLNAVIAIREGPDSVRGRISESLVEHVTSQYAPQENICHSEMVSQGEIYALAVFEEYPQQHGNVGVAFDRFFRLGQELTNVLRAFPDAVLDRLGIRYRGCVLDEWVRILFHFVWNFPSRFPGLQSNRYRLRKQGAFPSKVVEYDLQIWGDGEQTVDQYPGLVFSALTDSADLLTVTEHTLELLKLALRPKAGTLVDDQLKVAFQNLKHQFDIQSQFPRRVLKNESTTAIHDFYVLRLDSSFESPPAKSWASFAPQHDQHRRILSRRDAVKEVCVIQGASAARTIELLDRAGALLPTWPPTPYATLLENAHQWRERVKRLKQFSDKGFDVDLPDGAKSPLTDDANQDWVRQQWHATKTSTTTNHLITDDRGNVERWIGFVFDVIQENLPEEIELTIHPADERPFAIAPWNAMMTLKTMDIFQASIAAMEFAGFVSGKDQLLPTSDESKPQDPVPPVEPRRATKKKKERTEQSDSKAKLIGALLKHHNYSDGSCLNWAYIGNNELAKEANVSRSTASSFFKDKFGSHIKYQNHCRTGRLIDFLKFLSGEITPRDLYGSEPPEKRRDGRRDESSRRDD